MAAQVVSLNLCSDQLLVLLAPEQVAGLEPLARDPAISFVAARAAGLPQVRNDAEAVLHLHPDLVLAGRFSAQTTLALLRQRGVRVVELDDATDFPAIAAQVLQVARLLGVTARGQDSVAAMWRRLAAVRRASGTALLWQAVRRPGQSGRCGAAGGGLPERGQWRADCAGDAGDAPAGPAGDGDRAGLSRAGDRLGLASGLAWGGAAQPAAGADDLRRSVHGGGGFVAGTMRVLLAGLAGLLVASLLVGAAGAGVPDWLILWQIRLPRTLLAALVGAGLGLSGAVLQGALRNPLADPGLLGIGGCAALGAVLAYYWGISARFPPALPAGALLGATAGCALLVGFAGPALSGPSLILAGIALSAAASAFLALALSLAPNPFALSDITFWLMGGLEDRTMTHLALAAPVILAGVLVLLRLGARLDALSLGEATAATLGVPVRRTLLLASVGVTLAVGGGAAVAGGIGFVGLVVPHLLRPVFGQRPGGLLAPSAVGGAALLLAADLLARLVPLLLPVSGEPRLGVLTALLGAPFLVAIARTVAP